MSDQDNVHLTTLVGEGKKYEDAENLAKAYVHLEQHAETIKAEKQELQDKLGIKSSEETHLETIVNLLKQPEPDLDTGPTLEEIQAKQALEQKALDDAKNVSTEPEVSLSARMNMEQFATEAVKKYGDAKVVGEHLQKYMGDDKGRQALVQTAMQSDPSALLRMLPDADKSFNPTGNGVTPQGNNASVAMTWSDALEVRKTDPIRFKSPKYTASMLQAAADAKAKGIDFYNT